MLIMSLSLGYKIDSFYEIEKGHVKVTLIG